MEEMGIEALPKRQCFFFGIFQLCLMAVGILPIDNEDTAVQQNTV